MPNQRTFPDQYPRPSRSLHGCTPGFSVWLDGRFAPVEIRSYLVRTLAQTSDSTLALSLAELTGLALSEYPTASPLHLASVFLPASLGLADTFHFQEPLALPASASSSSRAGLPLPFHLSRLRLCCSLLVSTQFACSLVRTPLPTSLRRIFHCLVPGMARRSEQFPQASPASFVQ